MSHVIYAYVSLLHGVFFTIVESMSSINAQEDIINHVRKWERIFQNYRYKRIKVTKLHRYRR